MALDNLVVARILSEIGDMLELWPGEWVKASAIATVAALPPH